MGEQAIDDNELEELRLIAARLSAVNYPGNDKTYPLSAEEGAILGEGMLMLIQEVQRLRAWIDMDEWLG